MDATSERHYDEPMPWLAYVAITLGALVLLATAGFAMLIFWINKHDRRIQKEIETIRNHK